MVSSIRADWGGGWLKSRVPSTTPKDTAPAMAVCPLTKNRPQPCETPRSFRGYKCHFTYCGVPFDQGSYISVNAIRSEMEGCEYNQNSMKGLGFGSSRPTSPRS